MANEQDKKTSAIVFMADGFEEVEAITVIDVLRRAEIQTEIVSIMEGIEVTSAHGVKLLCDSKFENAQGKIDAAKALILPGGGEGTANLKKHEGLSVALKRFNEDKKLLAAICAAPSVLGKHGLLRGKTATCYPGFEAELDGAEVGGFNVILSENIITAKAAGCAAEFAFKIVELLYADTGLDGEKAAKEIKNQMFF